MSSSVYQAACLEQRCLELVQILDTADCEQQASFVIMRGDLPVLRRFLAFVSVGMSRFGAVIRVSPLSATALFDAITPVQLQITSQSNLRQMLILRMGIYELILYFSPLCLL